MPLGQLQQRSRPDRNASRRATTVDVTSMEHRRRGSVAARARAGRPKRRVPCATARDLLQGAPEGGAMAARRGRQWNNGPKFLERENLRSLLELDVPGSAWRLIAFRAIASLTITRPISPRPCDTRRSWRTSSGDE